VESRRGREDLKNVLEETGEGGSGIDDKQSLSGGFSSIIEKESSLAVNSLDRLSLLIEINVDSSE
jgi:hypothetical protein